MFLNSGLLPVSFGCVFWLCWIEELHTIKGDLKHVLLRFLKRKGLFHKITRVC